MDLLIGEMARRTGEAASTLRYWESAGLLPAPPRVNGRRHYPRSTFETIGLIQLAQQVGLSLASIRSLLNDNAGSDKSPAERWASAAADRARAIDDEIARLHAERRLIDALLACACDSFAGCLQLRPAAG